MSQVQTPYAVEVHDLSVSYSKKPVLWNLDLKIPEKKLIGILGPNGAGKSTLLKTIVGLVQPLAGEVKVLAGEFKAQRARVAYMPQRESVDWDFPATVWDVVMMGRDIKRPFWKWPTARDVEVVNASLAQVGLEALKERPIGSLSGGQQQRVFFARALAQEADLFLLDEPFAGIDAATEESLLSLLQSLVVSHQKTVVVVHHDLATARKYFNEVALINMRLIDFGDPNSVLEPSKLQLAYGVPVHVL